MVQKWVICTTDFFGEEYMEKITFCIRSTKSNGKVKVRFRLRNGRSVQLYHASDISADLKDIEKLNPDGTTKDRVKVYNSDLASSLKSEYDYMTKAYSLMIDRGLDVTSEVFEREIQALKYPVQAHREEQSSLLVRFRMFADNDFRDGVIGQSRYRHLKVVSDKLERFLTISGISKIVPSDFDAERLMEFRQFLFDEYKYVEKYPKLYDNVSSGNKPKARLSQNTVASQMMMLNKFFAELENSDEIPRSPFRKIGKEKKRTVFKTMYDEPYFLRKDEFQKILAKKVPPLLQDTKDAFLVQCAFGCRISDFERLGMDSIAVSDEGIPYIHYIPVKTANEQTTNVEVQTPIMRFAFDIIKRTGFSFPIIKNRSGKDGYSKRLKSLLTLCGITRPVAKYDEVTKKNNYVPICELASTKLARKTHVDLMNKVQIDIYAAGLHKEGSTAVKRYTSLELKDRFALMNMAFDQKEYKVNDQLEIING